MAMNARGPLLPSRGARLQLGRAPGRISGSGILRPSANLHDDSPIAANGPPSSSRMVTPTQTQPLLLASTTFGAPSSTTDPPSAMARMLVGAALAVSTVYALITAASSTPAGMPPTDTQPPHSPGAPASPASGTKLSAPLVSELPILRSPTHFDAFVCAMNRAGLLAVVLFHSPQCSASRRMEAELQRLSGLFDGRRIVFARVDAQMQGMPSYHAASPGGSRVHRCDLTALHRVHRTPTIRFYHNNTCVDEIVGYRPVDFRQSTSDLLFKYGL